MSLRAFAAAACLTMTITTPATGAQLQPTEKWHVFFDESQCLAQRNYGSKERPLYLVLKQPALGNVIQVAVALSRAHKSATEADGAVTFDRHASHKMSFLIYGPPKGNFRFYTTNLPLEHLAEARSAATVRIAVEGLDDTFVISDVGDLLKVMDNCVADLRNYWNLNEDSRKSRVSRGARGNLQGLLSSEDYPSDAVRNLESGRVKVALLINESGAVADCSVVETSGVAVLDAQACAAIKARARFSPAVGTDGKPVKDGFVQTIAWQLG